MLNKKDLIIGYAPTGRNIFSKEDAIKYKKNILFEIKKYGYTIIDIEDIAKDGLLLEYEDIGKVIKKFKEANVDCIFSPHCNFGTEFAVAKLAKEMAKPFLLWGPRDEEPQSNGLRLRDSQCGLFASSKVLQLLGAPFTYILNTRIEDNIFYKGFNNFTAAANVVKKFKKMRIGQIGVRPNPFWTVIIDEGELLRKFNIEIVPYNLEEVIEIAKKIKKDRNSEFLSTLSFIKDNFILDIEVEELENIISLKEAIKSLKQRDYIDAFAIQCWSMLQKIYNIVPCFANSLLFDEDIIVACETDIKGAITAVIAQAATFCQSKIIFADITNRHPYDDNSELLWHCGPFPFSIKKEKSDAIISKHHNLKKAGTCNWEAKGGDVSVIRFDGLNGKYNLFIGEAKGTTGPKTIGTYLWIKVKNWSKWENKLIYGPYIHHVVAVYGKISSILEEAVRYIDGLDIDLVETI